MFKSVFDLYRSKVRHMSTATAEERLHWQQVFDVFAARGVSGFNTSDAPPRSGVDYQIGRQICPIFAEHASH
jgi:hypothetical protein